MSSNVLSVAENMAKEEAARRTAALRTYRGLLGKDQLSAGDGAKLVEAAGVLGKSGADVKADAAVMVRAKTLRAAETIKEVQTQQCAASVAFSELFERHRAEEKALKEKHNAAMLEIQQVRGLLENRLSQAREVMEELGALRAGEFGELLVD